MCKSTFVCDGALFGFGVELIKPLSHWLICQPSRRLMKIDVHVRKEEQTNYLTIVFYLILCTLFAE
jgi:hypothetical protein